MNLFAPTGRIPLPSIPVLFFGNLDAYESSPRRVVTVGKNPSRLEFPTEEPLARFPLALDEDARNPDVLVSTLSAYYEVHPYRPWFDAFELMLNGLGSSYYAGLASRALHTDICSPLATDPTWTRLERDEQDKLAADGTPLWHALIEYLRPELVLVSVPRRYLDRIDFRALSDWATLRSIATAEDGTPRKQPYLVRGRRYEVAGAAALFVFGRAAQKPFGTLSHAEKQRTGDAVGRWADGAR